MKTAVKKSASARVRRIAATTVLLVLTTTGVAWAGCPPVDLDECMVLHRQAEACEYVDDAR